MQIRNAFFSTILILVVSIFLSNVVFAQVNDPIKRNTFYVELSAYQSIIRSSLIYNREITKLNAKQRGFRIKIILGLGFGNNGDGIDRRLKEEYLTTGIVLGIKMYKGHQLETGIQYYYSRVKEGYLGITENDEWEYDSILRFTVAYRLEWENTSFRVFIVPEKVGGEFFYTSCCPQSGGRRSEKRIDIYPGISFGIRF